MTAIMLAASSVLIGDTLLGHCTAVIRSFMTRDILTWDMGTSTSSPLLNLPFPNIDSSRVNDIRMQYM